MVGKIKMEEAHTRVVTAKFSEADIKQMLVEKVALASSMGKFFDKGAGVRIATNVEVEFHRYGVEDTGSGPLEFRLVLTQDQLKPTLYVSPEDEECGP